MSKSLPFEMYAPFGVVPRTMIDAMARVGRGVVRIVLYVSSLARSPGEWVRITHRRLSEISGYAVDTVRRYIAQAEKLGLLKRRYRWGDDGEQRANEYALVFVAPAEAPVREEKKHADPLRTAIERHASVWLANWNHARDEENGGDGKFETVHQALESPDARLAYGVNARGDSVYVTCSDYVATKVCGEPRFAGKRPRAVLREIARMLAG